MNTEVMFSSKTDLWETPKKLFKELDQEFWFVVDVCALPENAKCKKYYTPDQDGLIQEWPRWFASGRGACWVNPPYGKEIGKWVKKAYEEYQKGSSVVCLLPARTDTKWFHEYIKDKAEIRFVKGRLKFGDSKNSAPFPSMIVIYDAAC